MDTDRFLYIKTKYIYADITKNVETIFDTSNYDLDIPLPKEKNKKVIGIIKDELSGKIMKEFVVLRVKTYIYLKGDNDEDKKANGTKHCVIKRKLKFQDYKSSLEAAQIENKINHLEKKKLM